MGLQIRGSVESLFADDADKRTDGGVRQTMTRQISRLPESPAALFAHERFFPRVDSLPIITPTLVM